MKELKMYLGDGAYAEFSVERGDLKLTTEDGFGPTNTIYLSTNELVRLVYFAKSHGLLPGE